MFGGPILEPGEVWPRAQRLLHEMGRSQVEAHGCHDVC